MESAVLVMTTSSDMAQSNRIQPDHAMIARFADVVFGYCDGLAPIRALAEKGAPDAPSHTPFLAADGELAAKLALQADWAAGAGMALFVVPGTVLSAADARAESVVQTEVVLVDLDNGDITAKRDHLIQHLGAPTLEVASGGITEDGQPKRHLYWRLTEPAEGEDIARVCRARYMIASKVGGDPSFRSAHQPIRVAGSVHAKNGLQRLVEIVAGNDRDYDLGELIEAIVAMPPLEGAAVDELDFNGAREARGAVTELFARKIREGGVDGETRFDALSRVIGYWIRRCREGHVTPVQAWEEMVAYNAARIDPPWQEDRLRQEAERLWKRDAERYGDVAGDMGDGDDGGGGSAGGGDAGDGPIPVQFTEDALADSFATRHADVWRYVAPWGQWLTWTGALWRREDTLQAFDLARRICREAARRSASAKIRTKLSSAATVSAVERLARSDRRHATTTEVWDRDPWLLNTQNGIVDLRSGAGSAHDPLRYMTKIAGASVEGDCPVWLQFLDTVTGGDPELQAYLQRMAGLRGARIVTSIETEQGSRWAESKLKALTGGDKITARFMRQDFFEFIPQFKLLIVGKHKPSIRNVDEAMKRRLHMVPFTVTIPAAKRDKRLPDRLLAERDGILAWALQGCLEWQKSGLRPPPAVMAATDDYFEAEDALGRWIEERCQTGNKTFWAGSTELFNSWKSWAEANGEYAGSMKRFSESLGTRGFEKNSNGKARGFRGIRIQDSNDDLFAQE